MATKIADAYVELSARGMQEVGQAASKTAREIEKPTASLEKFSAKLDLAMGGGALAVVNALGGAFASLGANVRGAVADWDKGEGSLTGILDAAVAGIPLVGGFYSGVRDLSIGLSTLTARALDSAQGIQRMNIEVEKLRNNDINQSIRNIGDLRREMELLNSEGAEKELTALRHAFGARMDEIKLKQNSVDVTKEQLRYLEEEEAQLRRVYAAQTDAIKDREKAREAEAARLVLMQKQAEAASAAARAQRERDQAAVKSARNLQRMQADAARLLETLKTPEQVVGDRIKELQNYLKQGVITAKQFEALSAKARESLEQGAKVIESTFQSSFVSLEQFAQGIQTSVANGGGADAKATSDNTKKAAEHLQRLAGAIDATGAMKISGMSGNMTARFA
jgi:hypothetical protein